jgi:hypothetical protein
MSHYLREPQAIFKPGAPVPMKMKAHGVSEIDHSQKYMVDWIKSALHRLLKQVMHRTRISSERRLHPWMQIRTKEHLVGST